MSSVLERVWADLAEAGVSHVCTIREDDLSALLGVCEAAKYFTDGTSANFDFPQLDALKSALTAIERSAP